MRSVNKILAGVGLFTLASSFNYCADHQYGEPLTKGEKSLAKVFAFKKFDPGEVRKFFEDEEDDFAAATASANIITVYGPPEEYHSDDYSDDMRNIEHEDYTDTQKDNINFRAGLFVHEIIHIIQYQIGWLRYDSKELPECKKGEAAYYYDIEAFTKFKNLCMEQQAELIEDYVRHILHPNPSTWYDPDGNAIPDDIELLREVVEGVIPDIQKRWNAWVEKYPLVALEEGEEEGSTPVIIDTEVEVYEEKPRRICSHQRFLQRMQNNL